MKKHTLVAATALFVTAATLSTSCSVDPYELPAQEEYTREFIKTFGLIDPNQDWNTATSSSVKIALGSKARSVKTYMKVGDTYYLTGRFTNVDPGTLDVAFNMPAGTTDVLAKVDGHLYYGKAGGTIDVSDAGRGLPTDDDGNPISSTTLTDAGGNEYTISIEDTEWAYFNAKQMAPITANYQWETYWSVSGFGDNPTLEYTEVENPMYNYTRNLGTADKYYSEYTDGEMRGWGLLPELDKSNADTGNTSISLNGKKIIAQDFTIDPEGDGDIVVYPIYWNTSQTHTLGIYLIDEEGNAVKDASGEILHFPVYTADNTGQIEYYKKASSGDGLNYAVCIWYSLPDAFQAYLTENNLGSLIKGANSAYTAETFAQVKAEFIKWFNNNGVVDDDHTLYASDESGNISWGQVLSFPSSTDFKIVDISYDVAPANGNLYWIFTYTSRSSGNEDVYDELKPEGGSWESPQKVVNALYDTDKPMLMRSKGIHINLGSWTGRIGMYITNNDPKFLYSQRKNNTETDHPSYAASYQHPISKHVYFSFEDWTGDSDKDLNDLIFLLRDFGSVTGDDVTIDEDDPDEPIVDEPYSWLLAVEDLGTTDDFDFNDVVMKITAVATNEVPEGARTVGTPDADGNYTRVTFKALAAGGTLETYVFYGDTKLYPDGMEARAEWHMWFDEGLYYFDTMINTGKGTDNTTGATCTIYFGADRFNLATFADTEAADCFKIGISKDGVLSSSKVTADYFETDPNGYFIRPVAAGSAPQMFLIPDIGPDGNGWRWPRERAHIQSCYSSFQTWVSDKTAAPDWHLTPSSGLVCRPAK